MKGCRILVIEDELLVGLDVMSVLESAGASHVEHASTEDQALRLIDATGWDVVVADANLNGRSIEQVATRLVAKAIPFLVLTGYERSSLPAAVDSVPVLGKPFSKPALLQAVSELCMAK